MPIYEAYFYSSMILLIANMIILDAIPKFTHKRDKAQVRIGMTR